MFQIFVLHSWLSNFPRAVPLHILNRLAIDSEEEAMWQVRGGDVDMEWQTFLQGWRLVQVAEGSK